MAVVAFPFTCITSDDLDDEVPLASFGGSSQQTVKRLETLIDADCDVTVASACSSSAPVGNSLLDDNNTMIDNAFVEELNYVEDEHGDDNNDTVVVGEMEVEPATNDNNITTNFVSYGALHNLGNTCYLNAALQMIASLDSFVDQVRRISPHETNDNRDESEETRTKGLLRLAFLDLMASLSKGDTISPHEFKRLLDERTPLFLGFLQQDSHEFITTLFDLLDEDYKTKPESKDYEKTSENPISSADVDVEMNDKEKEKENKTVKTMIEAHDEMQDIADGEENIEKSKSLSVSVTDSVDKQAGLVYPEETHWQAFSDLQPDGIEKLLYARLGVDNDAEFTKTHIAPRCKLVGGRMAASETDHDILISQNHDVSMTSVVSMACDSLERSDPVLSDLSPVESYLKTEARVRLTCDSCKYTRTHTEDFFHLSLEIGADSSSVADGLRKFFSPEKREVKCEKCFCETAQQTMEITRLPRALLLHFKRFIVDVSDDYTSITYRKNQSDVLFEDTLELEEEKGGVLGEFVAADIALPDQLAHNRNGYDDGKRTYKIRSVVNHMGSSASCGHYTADVACRYPGGEQQWTRFNDSYVSRISPVEAMKESSRTAYMVMYELT